MSNVVFRYINKILYGILMLVIALLVLSVFTLTVIDKVPWFARKLASLVENNLNSLGIPVSIYSIDFNFPDKISLNNLYVSDKHGDTLIQFQNLYINAGLLNLTRKEIRADQIVLSDAVLYINKSADTSFNFSHILESFASDEKQSSPDGKPPFDFSLGKITLQNVSFAYSDSVARNVYKTHIGKLGIHFHHTDIQSRKIEIGPIVFDEVLAEIIINDAEENQKDSMEIPIDLDLSGNIRISGLSFDILNYVTGQDMTLEIARVRIKPEDIDLQEKSVKLGLIDIQRGHFSFEQTRTFENEIEEKEKSPSGFPWQIVLSRLNIDEFNFIYSDPQRLYALDPDHLKIVLQTEIRNIFFSSEAYHATINEFSVSGNHGISVSDLSLDFLVNDSTARINDFKMVTGNESRVNFSLNASYGSLTQVIQKPENTDFMAELKEITLSPDDLNAIASIFPSLKDIPVNGIYAEGNIKRESGTISISNFKAANGNSRILAEGSISGPGDIKHAVVDARIIEVQTNKSDLEKWLPDSLLPANMSLPENILITAEVKGSAENIRAKTLIETSYGNISGNVKLSGTSIDSLRHIEGLVELVNFNAGQLLSDTVMYGNAYIGARVDGLFGDSSIHLNMNLDIPFVDLSGYRYSDISFRGYIVDKNLGGTIMVKDENIDLTLLADIDFAGAVPNYSVDLNLEGIDLKALKLSEKPIKARGLINLDINGSKQRDLQGDIQVSNLLIVDGQESYKVDEITASLATADSTVTATLESEIIDVKYHGSVQLADLGNVVMRHFNKYFYFNPEFEEINVPENYELTIEIYNSDLITGVLLPKLNSFMPARLESSFNSDDSRFTLKGNFPRVSYAENVIDSFAINIKSDEESLEYQIGFEKLIAGALSFSQSYMEGNVSDDNLSLAFRMPDNKGKEKYLVSARILKDTSGYVVQFRQDSVILNYSEFTIPQNNKVRFGEGKFHFDDFILTSELQRIAVSQKSTDAYQMDFTNFEIQSLTGLAESGDGLAGGTLNGNIRIEQQDAITRINSDLDIDTLDIYGQPAFSTVSLTTSMQRGDIMNIHARLNGFGNDIKVSGSIGQSPDKKGGEIRVEMASFDLATLQPFISNQVNQLTGNIGGDIRINLSDSIPKISGELDIKELDVVPTVSNTLLKIRDESVTIEQERIRFRNFSLLDGNNNQMEVNGYVYYEELGNPSFDLRILSRNFSYINNPDARNAGLFYGDLVAGIDASLTGSVKSPAVFADISILDGTDFKIIIPGFTGASVEQEGLVEFVNRDSAGADIMTRGISSEDKLLLSGGSELDMTLNLDLSDDAILTIIVDPVAKEQLELRGSASLSFDLAPGRPVNLTGRYEIKEGLYNLTLYNLIRRQFRIEEGGYLHWTGSPLDAQANISAIYEVRTAPLPLIVNETESLSAEDTRVYSRQYPFLVYLNVSGELLQPQIKFDLKTPEVRRDAVIEAKLNQLANNETELHKQVFSLLVLNSFSSSSSETGDVSVSQGLSASARTSISNLLTRQINALSQKIVKGVDIDVAVSSYYQNKQDPETAQTQLDLNISKSFFNERLNVKVGGDFRLEGGQEEQTEASSIAGDLLVEYKLEESGTYRLNAFNRREYEGILEGEVNKTGLSFIYNKDFYELKDLFTPRKEMQDSITTE